ncbi:MAG: hypothetical protein IVW54_05405 [Candidatus Binataceae bacterium]|nr:hypothetical protein [Candidatus Binataceae bacterium]
MGVVPHGRIKVELGANRASLRLTRCAISDSWVIGYPLVMVGSCSSEE